MDPKSKIIISKELVSTGSGLLLWIPQPIVRNYKINDSMFANVLIKKFDSKKNITFFKKFKRVGKRFFIWIPQDVVEYLKLKPKDLVQTEIELK